MEAHAGDNVECLFGEQEKYSSRRSLTTHMQTMPVVKMVRRPKKDIRIQDTAVPIINIELRTMLSEKDRPVLTPAC